MAASKKQRIGAGFFGTSLGRRHMMGEPSARSGRYRSVFRPGLFGGQVIIVTGGGSGIGRCTAHELASLGATVALVGRKPEKVATVANEITEDDGKATDFVCD